MKFAYDIPGYVQGHRFSDEPDYYDATNQRFTDLAGGDRFRRYVSKTTGTPTFANRGTNNRRGLYLDNTCQWQFPFATPWMGSGVLVASYNTIDGATSGNVYGHIFGSEGLANITNNAMIFAQYNFGTRRLFLWGASSQLAHGLNIPDDNIVILAWSRDQEDRKSRLTMDGVSIDEIGPYASSTNTGEFIGLGQAKVCRLGNVTGDPASSAVSTQGTMHIFEQHFFSTNILRDHLSDTKDFIDTLKDHYGIA